MTWAQKHRFFYIGGALVVFLLVVVLPTVLHFNKPPTCFDKKQNQNELGVDCGGVCSLLCTNQYVPLNVLWSRFSKINDGVYNTLAYIENSNLSAGTKDLRYVFKLYGSDGFLLSERYGKVTVPPNKILAIFEPDLTTGKYAPQRVDFSFINNPSWFKQGSEEANITTNQIVLSREDSSPRLSAVITNKTVNPIKNIEAVGIVYNAAGNTLAFSRTVVDVLGDKESKTINFNWPTPFTETVARSEIILRAIK